MSKFDAIARLKARLDLEIADLTLQRDVLCRVQGMIDGSPVLTADDAPMPLVTDDHELPLSDQLVAAAPIGTDTFDQETTAPAAETTYVRGRWSDEEIKTTRDMLRKGHNRSEIAKKLGRNYHSIHNKCIKLRNEQASADFNEDVRVARSAGLKQAAAPKKAAIKPARTASKQVTSVPKQQSLPARKAAEPAEQPAPNLSARISPDAIIPDHNGWCGLDDLNLVQCMHFGDGVTGAANKLKKDRADVVARWKFLMPDPTPGAIQKLLSELTSQVEIL